MANKECFSIAALNVLMHFMFRVGEVVYSLGIKELDGTYFVYFEEMHKNRSVSTVLVKNLVGVAVTTKDITKENGYYKNYQANVYYYDNDYKQIKVDVSSVLDQMFKDEFGLYSILVARAMRMNFQKYADILSIIAAETKMEKRDRKLEEKDFLYFRSPWLVSDIQDFINDEYNRDKKKVIKKYFNQESTDGYLRHWNNIREVISWIKEIMNNDSEIIVSNNIYQNLIPLLVGDEAPGVNTKGIIIEKLKDNYICYRVHFMTGRIIFDKSEISKENIQELYYSNPLNENVEGLESFFGITRSR